MTPTPRRSFHAVCPCGRFLDWEDLKAKHLTPEDAVCPNCRLPIFWEDYVLNEIVPDVPDVPSETIDAVLKTVVAWAAQEHNLNDVESQSLRSLLGKSKAKLDIYMAALAMKKIQRLGKLMAFTDVIEDQLFDANKLAGSPAQVLVRLLEVVTQSTQNAVEFLQVQQGAKSKDGRPTTVDNRQVNITVGSAAGLSPTSREKIRGLIDSLVGAVSNADPPKGTPAAP